MPKKPVNSNMVPLDGLGIIPERDAGKPPILDIRHLCVDFGGGDQHHAGADHSFFFPILSNAMG